MKKLSVVLLLIMILQVTNVQTVMVLADDANYEEIKYVMEQLPVYCAIYDICEESVSICAPYVVTDVNNRVVSKLYIIKAADVIVGKMCVIYENGQYHSRFDDMVEGFREMELRGVEFAVTINEYGEMILRTGDISLDCKKLEVIIELELENKLGLSMYSARASVVPEITSLNVISDGQNPGICWAVATAMMVNYKKGTSYAGADIVAQCNNSPNYEEIKEQVGEVAGAVEWVREAYRLNGVSITDDTRGLIYARYYSLLSNNMPVHIDFYIQASYGAIGHAVVLCGTYWDGNTLVYTFADPNVAGKKVAVTQNIAAYNNGELIKYVTLGEVVYDECTHIYY